MPETPRLFARFRRAPDEPAAEAAFRLAMWWLGLVMAPTLFAFLICAAVGPDEPPTWLALASVIVTVLTAAAAVAAAVAWWRS